MNTEVYETVCTPKAPLELTVLMPVFRQESYVESAVRSVLDQEDIVLDVIISDDASGDETFDRALSAVRNVQVHPHSVRVRRGATRLGRAHIHQLVAAAKSSIVAQAHGDDVALPGRFRQLADVVRDKKAAFVTSGFNLIDAQGEVTETWDGSGERRPITLMEALERPPWSMGAMEAWVPQAFLSFAALDLEFAPVSHDRIFAVRAAMLGQGWLVDEPLIERRSHSEAWNRRLVDGGSPEARRHGWALVALMWAGVVLDDFRVADQKGLIDSSQVHLELRQARTVRDTALRELRRQHGRQLAKGKRLKWIGDP